MRRLVPGFILALLAGLVLFPATVAAQPVIDSSTIENGYPRTLTFKITARGESPVNDVTLRYSIKGRGTSALAKPTTPITPAAVVSAEIELDVNSSSAYIPVGSFFTYHWEVQSADGSVLVGPEETFLFLPPDKEWREVSNDFMTVHFHGDRESLARSYLEAGADTYQRIGRDLYGIELTNLPVRVILFANQQESELARPGSRGRFDAAVTVCGTKVTNDILLMIPESCGSPDITDVMRHELGHILNEIAGEGALAKLPSWLDEGAAVYAQTSPGGYEGSFRAAVAADRLIPFNQMGVPTTDANRVGVFYGQSYFMVRFLIEREGEARFAEFMRTIKSGTRFDQALDAVYGFDLAGFEDEFRAAYGLGPIAQPTRVPTQPPQQQQQQPTAAPTRAPQQVAGGSNNDRSLGSGTFIIFGLALLFGLAAIFSYLVATMLGNTRMATANGAPVDSPPVPKWTPPPAPEGQPPAWTLPSKDEAPRYVPPLAPLPPEPAVPSFEPPQPAAAPDPNPAPAPAEPEPEFSLPETDDDFWARKRDEARRPDGGN